MSFCRTTIRLGFVLFALVLTNPAAAELYGLVIGINDYGGPNNLRGAVADAKDVANALNRIGAKRVRLLTDGQATRQAILSDYRSLVAQARSGDTLVVHFAGHGAQEPIRRGDPDVDGDQKNEVFVLGGFLSRNDPSELIVDKEISALLARAGRRGIKVLFIADSCHSGGMTRNVNTGVRVRRINISIGKNRSRTRGITLVAPNDPGFTNIAFLSAVGRNQESPEVMINGVPRGALSWAFARALDKGAAKTKTHWLTPAHLRRLVVPTVIALTEGQQVPHMRPSPPPNYRIIHVAAGQTTPNQSNTFAQLTGTRKPTTMDPVTFATTNGAPPPTSLQHVRQVGLSQSPTLIWNRKQKRLIHRVGGLVAEEVEESDLDPIVSKWAAIQRVKLAMGRATFEIGTTARPKTFRRGETVEVRIKGIKYAHLTLLNLPPNGRVELLYPENRTFLEAVIDWRGKTFTQKFKVSSPPFGAEHLIAVFSKKRLSWLHGTLARMRDKRLAVNLPGVLDRALSNDQVQAGILPIYTAEKSE